MIELLARADAAFDAGDEALMTGDLGEFAARYAEGRNLLEQASRLINPPADAEGTES